MSSIHTLIISACNRAIDDLQQSNGSFPAGHNGPYYDPETPVRNTSHWAISLTKAYDITSNKKYYDAAINAVDYLLSDEARPHDASFHHRSIDGKDKCNGLIGQAWTIEALATVGTKLKHETALNTAQSVFKSHPFDEELGLWQRVEIDGTILSLDRTFNHQLWFAASGGLLSSTDSIIKSQVERFIQQLPKNMRVYQSGLIYHPLCPCNSIPTYVSYLWNSRKRPLIRSLLVHTFRPPQNRESIRNKAIGYHSFNTYALALLREQFPTAEIWTKPLIRDAVSYLLSDRYLSRIIDNKYAYPYNPPGFEVPYVLDVFQEQAEEVSDQLLMNQLNSASLSDTVMFRDSPDPHTSTARIYEATRMKDRDLPLLDEDSTL